jgi:hypothetical protein
MIRYTLGFILFVYGIAGIPAPGVNAQSKTPVRIAFDVQAKRIDLRTGKEIPEVTRAERGSIRFYLNRLDTPDEFINFYHDGFRKVGIGDLERMEKVQKQFAIWRLRYKSGSKNTPRVQHKAISFIPVNTDGKTGERVYLRLDDLSLIDFRE